ncbi:NAD-dependent epimerase/dehydratase family protein [Natronobacterium gregoryi]|uniref:Nucleoside-diphosphate-sugar epimerase n=2 Tax=Natronobacterium gregoryi TaxID=44930 RepID=L0AL19_NATGS|nr:NAD-dependent epimerase/dehydratase family protein [Natronobacterium gregoryi]AFZ74129.1 nucleoside-diphosphate-sugar epimerase [Natronobacterium gregoryi SP2]ELY63866.1 UDP-glucose 4-epimerase [Natronobacterium gregoryi SP2]PLK22076.1 UDP-glucose 4-epimerase [Natronobacterium gregoryi SP2]SFI49993.1 UDP-glucose 4-epimerase [Natronobacterium gregoryi]
MSSPAIRDKTILVTGGAGFIGSHLVETLAPHNEVRVLDDFSSGRRASLPEPVDVYEGDVCDPILLQRAAHGVDLIFHQAAMVSVDESVDAPRRSNRTNVDAGLLVLEQARQEDARVVVASSAAIYGHPEALPVPETAATEPASPYGIQKLALDQYARRYEELYDLPTVTLRYFNVYGPRQQGPYSGVISTFLEQARADDPITIEGDGKQTRDFVHVDDVVRANLAAATTDEVGTAYNIGTGERTSIDELAETIRSATKSSSPIVHHEPRPGDVRHSGADVSRARRRLGFEPRVSLESGVRSLVADGESTATSAVSWETGTHG